MRDRADPVPGGERDRVRPQPLGRARREPERDRRPGRERRAGRQVEQHGRAQLLGPPGVAGRAALDVPVDALAEQDRQAPVPAAQQGAELVALAAAGPADQQRRQARLELIAGPGQQRVRVVAGDAEHGRDLGRLEPLAQLKLDDLALARVQPQGGVLEQRAQVGPLGAGGDVAGVVGHVPRLVQRRRAPLRPEDPQRLIPRHRVQPGTKPIRVTQPAEPGRGDDKGVLNGVRGVGRVGEQGSAVLVEGICVPVVGSGKPEGVARHDGRDNLAVAHANTLAVLWYVRDKRGVIVGIPTSATLVRRSLPGSRVPLARRPGRCRPRAHRPDPRLQPAPAGLRPVSRPEQEATWHPSRGIPAGPGGAGQDAGLTPRLKRQAGLAVPVLRQ